MKKDSKKDSGVSPVIGTILLVAITVVLVAIISAVVMGMTGDVSSGHVVGVKASGSNLIITGGDYADLDAVSINGADPASTGNTYTIGSVLTSSVSDTNTIVGIFKDGSKQVIYTKN